MSCGGSGGDSQQVHVSPNRGRTRGLGAVSLWGVRASPFPVAGEGYERFTSSFVLAGSFVP